MRTLIRIFAVAVVASTASIPPAAANPQIYERALGSVAFVISIREKGQTMIGTGTLVNERERIVLTNYHVVGDGNETIIFFPAYKGNDLITNPDHYLQNVEKLGIAGKVLARSKERDLALIKLASLPTNVREMPLAPQSPKPGETLHAVGNSGQSTGVLWRYSKGEVRQVYVRKFTCGSPPFEVNARIVETQIPINKGDSGGPVLNQRGELNAISQGYQDESAQRLVSTMIDISEIRSFLKKEKLLPNPAEKDPKK